MPLSPLFRATCGSVMGRSYLIALHSHPPFMELVICDGKILVNYWKMYNKMTFKVSDIEYVSELHTWGRHGILIHHTVDKYSKYVYLFFAKNGELDAAKKALTSIGVEVRTP